MRLWHRRYYYIAMLYFVSLLFFAFSNILGYSNWIEPYGTIIMAALFIFNFVYLMSNKVNINTQKAKIACIIFLIVNFVLVFLSMFYLGTHLNGSVKIITLFLVFVATLYLDVRGGIVFSVFSFALCHIGYMILGYGDLLNFFTCLYQYFTAFILGYLMNWSFRGYRKDRQVILEENSNRINELWNMNNSLNKKINQLQMLYEISKVTDGFQQIQDIFNDILRTVSDFLEVLCCSIMIYDEQKEGLIIKSSHALSEVNAEAVFLRPGEGIAGYAFLNKSTAVYDAKHTDIPFASICGHQTPFPLIAVPLWVEGKVIGVLNIGTVEGHVFTKEEIETIEEIARKTGAVIENLNRYTQLERQTVIEGMTGLYNYIYFNKSLEEGLEKSRVNRQKLALVFIDIDKFKPINDKYGHLMGDKVIIKVSEIIKASIRDSDIACRYGGEEFAVILPNSSFENAKIVAQRIRSKVEDIKSHKEFHSIEDDVTVSIGISIYPDCCDNKIDLIKIADKRMYFSKTNGGNRISPSD